MTKKYKKIREAIIKACPELLELEFGQRIKSKYGIDNVGKYIVKERKEYRSGGMTDIYYDVVNSLAKDKPFEISCGDLEDNYKIIGKPNSLVSVLKTIDKTDITKCEQYKKENWTMPEFAGHIVLELVDKWDFNLPDNLEAQIKACPELEKFLEGIIL